MANTITDLYPDLYAALDVVSRELVGLIPAVTMDAGASRAGVGQDVVIPVSPDSNSMIDTTPAMSVPAAADQTIGNVKMQITKSKIVPFSWQGNEQDLLNSGVGYLSVRAGQMAQAMRTLCNAVETDLASLQSTFSRAYGTAATTPFATAGDFTDMTNTLKILKDNGAPVQDNHLVVNTSAGAVFLGKQAEANRQGSDSILRQGVFLSTAGVDIRESGQIVTQTAGSFTSGTLTSAVRAVGETSLVTTADYSAGLGAGDAITLAHESGAHKYIVQSVTSGAITIAAPGLRTATAASGTVAITKVASSARNMLFNRSAIVLATRMPERPAEGDMAIDVGSVTDPRSGLTFEVAIYPGYRKVRYEIGLAWGYKNIKPAHTALLLG